MGEDVKKELNPDAREIELDIIFNGTQDAMFLV